MAIELELTGSHLAIRLYGTLTDADLLQLGDEILAIESAAAVPPHRITDMTDLVKLQIGFAEVHALAERRRTSTLTAPIRSAIVTGSDSQYGIARMFQTLNDHPQITLEIFRDHAAALEWLQGADVRSR